MGRMNVSEPDFRQSLNDLFCCVLGGLLLVMVVLVPRVLPKTSSENQLLQNVVHLSLNLPLGQFEEGVDNWFPMSRVEEVNVVLGDPDAPIATEQYFVAYPSHGLQGDLVQIISGPETGISCKLSRLQVQYTVNEKERTCHRLLVSTTLPLELADSNSAVGFSVSVAGVIDPRATLYKDDPHQDQILRFLAIALSRYPHKTMNTGFGRSAGFIGFTAGLDPDGITESTVLSIPCGTMTRPGDENVTAVSIFADSGYDDQYAMAFTTPFLEALLSPDVKEFMDVKKLDYLIEESGADLEKHLFSFNGTKFEGELATRITLRFLGKVEGLEEVGEGFHEPKLKILEYQLLLE